MVRISAAIISNTVWWTMLLCEKRCMQDGRVRPTALGAVHGGNQHLES